MKLAKKLPLLNQIKRNYYDNQIIFERRVLSSNLMPAQL